MIHGQQQNLVIILITVALIDCIFLFLALLLLYDVTNRKSFNNTRAWLGEIREYAQGDVVIMLLGESYIY